MPYAFTNPMREDLLVVVPLITQPSSSFQPQGRTRARFTSDTGIGFEAGKTCSRRPLQQSACTCTIRGVVASVAVGFSPSAPPSSVDASRFQRLAAADLASATVAGVA